MAGSVPSKTGIYNGSFETATWNNPKLYLCKIPSLPSLEYCQNL